MTKQEKQQLVDAVITQLKNEGTDVSSASVVEDVNGVSYVLCYDTNGNIVRVSPDTINQQESTNKDAIKANATAIANETQRATEAEGSLGIYISRVGETVNKTNTDLTETKKDIANQLFAASTADKVNITGRNEQSMRINFSAEIPAATTEKAGVMSAEDKNALENVNSVINIGEYPNIQAVWDACKQIALNNPEISIIKYSVKAGVTYNSGVVFQSYHYNDAVVTQYYLYGGGHKHECNVRHIVSDGTTDEWQPIQIFTSYKFENGTLYGYKYGESESEQNKVAIVSIPIGSAVAELIQEVTYSELVALRDNAGLVAGMKYRITDYVTTTVQKDTKSANHPFDVIVEAVSENELSELAQATQHEGDTYFDGNDLGAWQLWYDLDNNTDKYRWADTENGKGVIYRMIDEKNNDCPYDFKNILFYTTSYTINTTSDNYYYTFSYVISGVLYDGTTEKRVINCHNNNIRLYYTNGKSILNGNIFINSSFRYGCANNKFEYNCANNTFGDGCYYNTFGYNCQYNKFGDGCYYNTFGYNCYNNKFGDGCYNNKFGYNCYNNTFGNDCDNNTFGYNCYYNNFGNGCNNNNFGNGCDNNTFGYNCNNNTFGYDCYYNNFGNRCNYNTFGYDCNNNTFDNDCDSNTFGSGMSNRQINSQKTSITLNDEYYDDGTNALVPIKHPDLSTQPNILPYKFMGQYVYEQLIPIEFKAGAWVIPKDAKTSIHLFDMSILKVSILCKYEGKLIPMSVNGISYGTEEGVYLDTDMKINGKSITYNYNAYAHIVYTSMPEEGGYYYNSAILKGILVKFNGLDATPGSLYDGSTSIEPVALDQGYHYDIPNDYGSSTGYNGFSISPSFGESITVQYSIPAFGETGTLERDIINNPSYVPLPVELVDKAKLYLVIITIENI